MQDSDEHQRISSEMLNEDPNECSDINEVAANLFHLVGATW